MRSLTLYDGQVVASHLMIPDHATPDQVERIVASAIILAAARGWSYQVQFPAPDNVTFRLAKRTAEAADTERRSVQCA